MGFFCFFFLTLLIFSTLQIRNELEKQMNCNLKEFKEFIDNEMLLILGQMDKPSLIFDHLYLVRGTTPGGAWLGAGGCKSDRDLFGVCSKSRAGRNLSSWSLRPDFYGNSPLDPFLWPAAYWFAPQARR